jgi:hypothetical protein
MTEEARAEVNKERANAMNSISLPKSFPIDDYTPNGYIDNPYHSMVLNRSGVIRSVPPLGFGWWRRTFPGCYGSGPRAHINYISFLQMSVFVSDKCFITTEDFDKNGVKLVSRYHTKHMMSYDWSYGGLNFSFKYFLPRENSLACLIETDNRSGIDKIVYVNATNIYGLWEIPWWGSDGVATRYSREFDASISKIWAYGDVFVLCSNMKSIAHKATESEKEWEKWLREHDTSSVNVVTIHGPGPIRAVQTYKIAVPAMSLTSALVILSRGVNELWALNESKTALKEAVSTLEEQLAKDEKFWSNCPMLEGDWPEVWKHGWVYDWETIRMNVRQPIGIYKHHWDAMQIHSPRVVLGETALDMMMLSYADAELAKEVIYGTFADALAPNVPCSREDGSVNMIAADGAECGTAPSWVFPFHVIQSIYERTLDDQWIKKMYPFLKGFLEWWYQNRTDKDGWFHCKCSWESGQDGSKRFLIPSHDPGGVAEFVRTVDVEASIAEATRNMGLYAKIASKTEDEKHWRNLAERRAKAVQEMFVDGWFRDFDARTNQPIILKGYYDIMMLSPVTCGIATPEQIEAVKKMFEYFRENPRNWLEWPSFIFPFSEAAWNAGLRMLISEVLADIADRIYARTDAKTVHFRDKDNPFAYRVPGVANEFWPISEEPAGGENYGWGATLPVNIIRNIVGFREASNLSNIEFFIAPSIPRRLVKAGKKYTITNLHYRGITSKVTYVVKDEEKVDVILHYSSEKKRTITVANSTGGIVFQQDKKKVKGEVSFEATNGSVYLVRFV